MVAFLDLSYGLIFQFFWDSWVYSFFVVSFDGLIFGFLFIIGAMSTSNIDIFGVRLTEKNDSTFEFQFGIFFSWEKNYGVI